MNKRLQSFAHALRGIYECIRLGVNAKIQLLAAVIICLVGAYLKFTAEEWMAVVICIALVLSLESINTTIELLADEVSLERRPTVRRIKDMAAGAVLIAAIGSIVIAAIILFQHLRI